MNIFGVSSKILYPLFVYVLFFSKWILVESTDSLGGSSPSFGSGTKTGVDLSLKDKKAKNEFNYEKNGQIVTYAAKDNYGFKSVKTSKNGDIVVWSTSNPNEYATKVVLDGKGKKVKKVTIYFPNNTTKVFKRDGKGKPWTTVSQQSNQATSQPGSGTPSSGTTPSYGTSQPVFGSSQSANQGTHGRGASLSQANEGTRGGGGSHGTTGGHGSSGSDPNGGMRGGSHGMSSTGSDPEKDGSQGSTPPSGGASQSGGRTSTGGGTDQSSDGSGGTHTGGKGGDGQGGGTTPPANEGSGNDASAGGEDNSKGNEEASSKEEEDDEEAQGGGNPADSPNDLMKKFDKLVGDTLKQKDYPKDIKLFKPDPNDSTKTVELDKSEYKIKKFAEEHLYVFYDLNCTLIKCGENVVWQYGTANSGSTTPDGTNSGSTTPDPTKTGSTTPDGTKADPSQSNTKYPKGMNVEPDLILIYFGEYTEVHVKRSDEWNLSRTETKDLSQLKVVADSKQTDRTN